MKDIYIAECDKNGGIYHYMLDNKKLTFCDKTEFDRVMYLAHSDGNMYALLREAYEDGTSAVVKCSVNNDKSLSKTDYIMPTNGKVACHLCVADDVYCVNYISGSVSKISGKTVVHEGKGVNPVRQDKAHTHYVTVTHDGYVLVTDLGLDRIFTYTKDLEYVSEAAVPSGYGARHLIFSEDKSLLYCVNELVSSVSVFEYNDGHLNILDTYSALPKDFNEQNTAAAIRIHKDRLYVSNRGHNSIAVFKINGKELELEEIFSCGGEGPRDFDIFEDVLISTNQDTDDVTVIDLKTRQAIQKISLKDPLCVIGI